MFRPILIEPAERQNVSRRASRKVTKQVLHKEIPSHLKIELSLTVLNLPRFCNLPWISGNKEHNELLSWYLALVSSPFGFPYLDHSVPPPPR